MKRYLRASMDDEEIYDEEINPSEMYWNAIEDEDFFDVIYDVMQELGLYLDTSSIRSDYGTIFLFSDPEHENQDVDMWMGDPDAEVASIDYQDYLFDVATNVLTKDKSEWYSAYKSYIESLI